MRLNDGLATMHGPGPRGGSAWRWFPHVLIAAMGVVFAVNGLMVWAALGTFPGQAGSDGFDLSNHYDQVLQRVQREATLGWSLQATADDLGRPVLLLADGAGAPLRDAAVVATAERPVGPPEPTHLMFRSDRAGHYVADVALATPGQWELQVSISAAGHTVAMTRRVVRKPLPSSARGRATQQIDAARSAG